MPRLPQPGQDDGTWGAILNDYLTQSHTPQGALKDNVVGAAQLQDTTITETKLASAVQTKLNQGGVIADGAVTTQKLADGAVSNIKIASTAAIARSKLASDVQTSLSKADDAYQKPPTGIPSADLDSATQASLASAASAEQTANKGQPNGYAPLDGSGKVPSANLQTDSDLTEIAALTPADNDLIQRKAGAWTNRTLAQLRDDLTLVRATNVSYTATITPNADTTDVLNIGALTNALTLANPTGTPRDGQNLRIRLIQDSTGGRIITFGSAYAFGTDVTASLLPTTANAKWEMLFTWNAADSKWRAMSIARGF